MQIYGAGIQCGVTIQALLSRKCEFVGQFGVGSWEWRSKSLRDLIVLGNYSVLPYKQGVILEMENVECS